MRPHLQQGETLGQTVHEVAGGELGDELPERGDGDAAEEGGGLPVLPPPEQRHDPLRGQAGRHVRDAQAGQLPALPPPAPLAAGQLGPAIPRPGRPGVLDTLLHTSESGACYKVGELTWLHLAAAPPLRLWPVRSLPAVCSQ